MASPEDKRLGSRNKPNKAELNPIASQQDPFEAHYGINGFHEHILRDI
jgi:hypothetical protein